MVKSLKRWFRQSLIFNYNELERDLWVKRRAALVPPGQVLLDVGAGSCPYRPYFSHCTYKTQDFTRLNPDQLREQKGYGEIDYVCDATAIPVPDNSFDVVLCTEVLEHVPEPIKVVREIGRIVKPGGTLLLTAPLGSGLHQEPYHYYGGYTPYWYRRFLKEAGFSQIEIEANRGFFKLYGQESIRFVRLIAPRNQKAGSARQLIILPLWLLCLPVLGFVVPLVCHFLDAFDPEPKFTAGYHVTAVKPVMDM